MTPLQKRVAELETTLRNVYVEVQKAKPALIVLSDFYRAWRAFDNAMSEPLDEPDHRELVKTLRDHVLLHADKVRMTIKE